MPFLVAVKWESSPSLELPKLVALFLKVQLCQISTVYRLKLFVIGIRFKSFGISVKAVAYSF